MDTRNSNFHGQFHVTGHAPRPLESGPIVKIVSQMVLELAQINPRANSAGVKLITLTLSSAPIDNSSEALDNAKKIAEVDAGINWNQEQLNDSRPRMDESFEDYYQRQLDDGLYPAAAMFLACDWFDRPQEPNLMAWMSDEQAVRFRLLNSSTSTYESAAPDEYAVLRHYCVSNYPEFVSLMTLREA